MNIVQIISLSTWRIHPPEERLEEDKAMGDTLTIINAGLICTISLASTVPFGGGELCGGIIVETVLT